MGLSGWFRAHVTFNSPSQSSSYHLGRWRAQQNLTFTIVEAGAGQKIRIDCDWKPNNQRVSGNKSAVEKV
jgi:hypothetical protein